MLSPAVVFAVVWGVMSGEVICFAIAILRDQQ